MYRAVRVAGRDEPTVGAERHRAHRTVRSAPAVASIARAAANLLAFSPDGTMEGHQRAPGRDHVEACWAVRTCPGSAEVSQLPSPTSNASGRDVGADRHTVRVAGEHDGVLATVEPVLRVLRALGDDPVRTRRTCTS
jgi:hypothetical protein